MEHIERTISDVEQQIVRLLDELKLKKRMVNDLSGMLGRPAVYPDIEEDAKAGPGAKRVDEFYGIPLATAVKTILERRKAANLGAAAVNEIYEALKAGGYHFETKNDENAKRGLYGSLSKNTTTFHRLPSGAYGLRSWYSSIKERTKNARANAAEVDDADSIEGREAAEAVVAGSPDVESELHALKPKPR